jgi:hypothetical protein
MPAREVDLAPEGPGVVSMDQLVPFQRSASAAVTFGLKEVPTAMQFVADVQETAARKLFQPVALGVVWMDQLVPFQRSASVRGGPKTTE